MSNLTMGLYVAVLFVLLTPGILLRLPPKGSPLVVAIVHGAVFALILCLMHKMVLSMGAEGFDTPCSGNTINKMGGCQECPRLKRPNANRTACV